MSRTEHQNQAAEKNSLPIKLLEEDSIYQKKLKNEDTGTYLYTTYFILNSWMEIRFDVKKKIVGPVSIFLI